jgi:hypothetical protein
LEEQEEREAEAVRRRPEVSQEELRVRQEVSQPE